MISVIISLFFLLLPTWFEVYRDRNGDVHPNADWKLRGITCMLVGGVAAIILGHLTVATFTCYTLVSICFFTSIFPYWINYVHLKNKVTWIKDMQEGGVIAYGLATRKEKFDHIVNHLSNTAWPDDNPWWRGIGWKGRMFFYIDILLLGVTIFFFCYIHTHA